MTLIGVYTHKEFIHDFPIDLGMGKRACIIANGDQKPVGVILVHRVGEQLCGGSVFWRKVENQPQWSLHSLDPLHVEPSVRCSCGLHGHIRDGKWQDV